MTNESLLRRLGFREAIALVVGNVIGTGVFLKAAVMSQQVGSPMWVLLAWLVAGVLSLAGALCYAELGSLFPKAGGEYVYLREAYGDLSGFLFGWMRFWIATPGSMAAYAVATADFLNGIVKVNDGHERTIIAALVIGAFSLVNCFTVIVGGRIQVVMMALKVAMIVGLTLALLTGTESSWEHISLVGAGHWQGFSAFGMAMIAALWAYDGWNNMPMAAGEIRNPGKTIPLALGGGMAIVLALYCLVNFSYFFALPFSEVSTSLSKLFPSGLPVAAKAAAVTFGPVAFTVFSVAFIFSACGSLNATILTGARVPFAMARDKLFFRQLGELSQKTHVPVISVVVQAIIAMVLAASGTFDQLTDYVVFAGWIFYALVAASLFVFRRRLPNVARPFKTPGYPLMPAVFIGCAALLLVNTVLTDPWGSGIGLAFIAAGVPFYFCFRWQRDR